ncbi:MAG: hypothetical protein H7270_04360, partial [Dermatophilaceae bacterium]|nr:hypothetical protein [Dermatophilaceae bacterium]
MSVPETEGGERRRDVQRRRAAERPHEADRRRDVRHRGDNQHRRPMVTPMLRESVIVIGLAL